MAFIERSSVVLAGDVLLSEVYNGRGYGLKVLKEVQLEGEVYYIVQYGEVASEASEFAPYNGGKDLGLLKDSSIRESYAQKWVKGAAYKNGDILITKDNKQVFVVRGKSYGKPKLYRVTGGDSMWDTLANYVARYGELTQVSPDYYGGRFSDAV